MARKSNPFKTYEMQYGQVSLIDYYGEKGGNSMVCAKGKKKRKRRKRN